MVSARRVSTRDIALAGGSLDALITKLIEQVRSGNMEQREVGAMFIHSLTDQPRGLAGEQEAENGVLLARAGAIRPLVALVTIGSPVAQHHACGALAVIAAGRKEYQEEIAVAGGVPPLAAALRAGDPSVQEMAAAAIASVSQLVS